MSVVLGALAGAVAGPLLIAAIRWCVRRPWPLRPARAGLVVAATAAAGVVSVGLADRVAVGLVWWLVLVPGVAIAAVDLHEHRIPDRLLAGSAVPAAAVMVVGAAQSGSWDGPLHAAVAGAFAFALYYVVAMFGGFGYGDVKLAGLLGAAAGYQSVPAVAVTMLFGSVLAVVAAAVVAAVRRRRDPFPLGPALVAGAAAGVGWLAVLT